jgi:threonine dehydrogenase-like Zn-dependent dehydrogenase
MGHEFTGTVMTAGSAVRSVAPGDKIISPFTISCGSCFYCRNSFSSRCSASQLFGTPALPGGQSTYVRVPLADSTVLKAPASIPDEALVLMADIFPTGYFGAANAFRMLTPEQMGEAVIVVVGCGPVGLCAIVAVGKFGPKKIFAVDSVASRLELAKGLGAEPLNFLTDKDGMEKRVREETEGRGADIVIEVVGLSPALRTGFDLLRPFGILSSSGVHNAEVSKQLRQMVRLEFETLDADRDKIPWTAKEAYGKNLRLLVGRCPVRSIFAEALELFQVKQDMLRYVKPLKEKTRQLLTSHRFMFDTIMSIDDAVEGYDLFDKMKAQKVVFQM